MQDDYFDEYLKLMRAYIKTLRLSFNGHTDWSKLDTIPRDFHVRAMQVIYLIGKEYQVLPESKWQEKIKYYKKTQDEFDADHRQESNEYCQYLAATRRESLDEFISANEQIVDYMDADQHQTDMDHFRKVKAKKEVHAKRYKQNQSYMEALIRTRKEIDRWAETTSIPLEKKLSSKVKVRTNSIIKDPTMDIEESSQQGIYTALAKYIHNKDHKLYLIKLLAGEKIPCHIVIEHQQGSIAYVFRQALEAKKINSAKTKIRDWLVYWFRLFDGQSQEPLNPGTIYEALTKDKKPAKINRIPYTP